MAALTGLCAEQGIAVITEGMRKRLGGIDIALTMAAAYPKPPRPKAVVMAEAMPAPAPTVQAEAEPTPEPAKRRGRSGRTPKVTTAKYEWDVYSGILN